jgi:hypothetical protein
MKDVYRTQSLECKDSDTGLYGPSGSHGVARLNIIIITIIIIIIIIIITIIIIIITITITITITIPESPGWRWPCEEASCPVVRHGSETDAIPAMYLHRGYRCDSLLRLKGCIQNQVIQVPQ